jgi:hypothetical protein
VRGHGECPRPGGGVLGAWARGVRCARGHGSRAAGIGGFGAGGGRLAGNPGLWPRGHRHAVGRIGELGGLCPSAAGGPHGRTPRGLGCRRQIPGEDPSRQARAAATGSGPSSWWTAFGRAGTSWSSRSGLTMRARSAFWDWPRERRKIAPSSRESPVKKTVCTSRRLRVGLLEDDFGSQARETADLAADHRVPISLVDVVRPEVLVHGTRGLQNGIAG